MQPDQIPEPGGDEEVTSPDAPAHFVGEYTEQDVLDYLDTAKGLPAQLRGVEERFTSSLNPLVEGLQALQGTKATQPAFEPKLDKVIAALTEYDAGLAKSLGPALEEALKESFSVTPLDQTALQPHIQPLLSEERGRWEQEMAMDIVESLPFEPDAVVSASGAPETDVQKDFAAWWGQIDKPTQDSMRGANSDGSGPPTSVLGYARGMRAFGKWRSKRIQDKGEDAGAAVRRLAGASSPSSSGRANPPTRGMQTEKEGFMSVFNKAS